MGKLTGFYVPQRKKAYFFAGDKYVRYDVASMSVDEGYPKPISGNWKGAFDRDIDAAIVRPAGDHAYFFRGDEYVKIDMRTNTVLAGYPKPISGNWPGLFEKDVDAAVALPDGRAYFMRGSEYVKYDLTANTVAAGYPKPIAGNWHGMFDREVDALVAWPDGHVYAFRGRECVRHDLRTNTAVAGYPKPIPVDWPGLPFPAAAAPASAPRAGGFGAKEAFAGFITPFEGRVSWMYLDVKGLVTVGVGNLIDPERYALDLPFGHKSDATPASRAEISAEWQRVKADASLARKGHVAAGKVTTLRLTEAYMDELLRTKLESNEATLRRTFPEWDDWPADAQLGLHSMAWAMGPAFTAKWPKFTAAVRRRDWLTAAAESRIPGAREHRNAAHAALFHNAAAIEAQGLDGSGVYHPVEL